MPKISVIIPAYNAMAYLPATMATVLNQTFADFEVIVVNDGSSDETGEWVSQISDPRVKLISQKNQGNVAARNLGIAHAQGEYIAFLDADDLWEPTKLEKQVRCFEENPEIGLVYTWVALIDEKGKPTGRMFKSNAEGNVWRTLTKWNIVICGSVAVVHRCCFKTCGVFDRNLGSHVEDWEMWLRIATCYPFKVIKETLVYYRQRSTSTSKNLEAMARSYHLVIEKAFRDASWQELSLRNRSYGTANLVLAWIAIQSQARNYKQANHFRRQAFQHDPWLFFSKEYFRLSLAIIIMRCLGPNGYNKYLSVFHTLRRHTLSPPR